jgi:hypothetical protein
MCWWLNNTHNHSYVVCLFLFAIYFFVCNIFPLSRLLQESVLSRGLCKFFFPVGGNDCCMVQSYYATGCLVLQPALHRRTYQRLQSTIIYYMFWL